MSFIPLNFSIWFCYYIFLIEYNDLTGLIQIEKLSLTSLEVLLVLCNVSNISVSLLLFCSVQSNCNSNTFEGSIPISELGSMTSLQTLDLGLYYYCVIIFRKCFL